MTPPEPTTAPPNVWAVALDFEARVDHRVELAGVLPALAEGKFVWLDVDLARIDEREAQAALESLEIPDEVIEDALTDEAGTQHGRWPDCLHMVMAGCRIAGTDFDLQRVDVVFNDRYLVTVHHGTVTFLEKVKRDYREDFLHHAQTPSFLVYELWDHLLDRYMAVQNTFEQRVEKIQAMLTGDVDDRLFADISELGADLLELRKVLLPARAVLTDLATRRSRFVSEATQPFLANMSGTVERVLQDLLVDREILSDSLNLYMSAVSHRTNEVMRRLTVVSVIFLPLTFLVGVYGMNFDVMPELHWSMGYALFWTLVVGLTGSLLWLMRRKRLL